MNKKPLILTAIAILAVIGAAVGLAIKPAAKAPAVSSTPAPTVAEGSPALTSFVISYSGDSFSPAETTVKSGDSVTFTNRSQVNVEVDSDPHPIHTDDTDLNVGVIAPGESKTIKLIKTGDYGIHNHLNPAQTAKISIK